MTRITDTLQFGCQLDTAHEITGVGSDDESPANNNVCHSLLDMSAAVVGRSLPAECFDKHDTGPVPTHIMQKIWSSTFPHTSGCCQLPYSRGTRPQNFSCTNSRLQHISGFLH